MKPISGMQMRRFWRSFSAACRQQGLAAHEEREEYRKRVLREEAGVESLRDVDGLSGFDRVMQRVESDAGNWERAISFSQGDWGRMRHKIEAAAQKIVGVGEVRPYVEALARKLGCVVARGCGWDYSDCSLQQLRKVLAALEKQVKRLERKSVAA